MRVPLHHTRLFVGLAILATVLGPTVALSQSQQTSYSLWSPTASPNRAGGTDQSSVELGVRFTADVAGTITGVRFYKSAISNSQHTVSLWSTTGQLLAQASTTSETSSGWQQAALPTPLTISPGTPYIASYHTNGYVATQNYFNVALDAGPLHALGSGASGGNGLYLYTSTPALPTNSYLASNYWVDVTFVPATSIDTVPTATSVTTPVPTSTPLSSPTLTPIATVVTPTPTLTPTTTPTPTNGGVLPTTFACTEIVGFSETQQWYDGGFVAAVPNPTSWQLRWYPGGSIDLWARGSSFAGWSPSSLVSHCASGSAAPDRVILNVSGDYNSDPAWCAHQTQAALDYIRTVYSPGVKQLAVQPVVGGPASSLCGTATNPPSNWVRATYNFPVIKAGLQQVLSPTVVMGADPQVRTCADYLDLTGHLASAGASAIGANIAAFYSQPPR